MPINIEIKTNESPRTEDLKVFRSAKNDFHKNGAKIHAFSLASLAEGMEQDHTSARFARGWHGPAWLSSILGELRSQWRVT